MDRALRQKLCSIDHAEFDLRGVVRETSGTVAWKSYEMPNIGSLLKTEFARICRREIRRESAALRRASVAYRRDIAALKRRLAEAERKTSTLAKQRDRTNVASAPAAADNDASARFQARGLRSLRKRLGLSQEKFAALVGVSGLTVYNWESGRAAPRKERLAAIVQLRKMGKREVETQLASRSSKRAPAKAKRKRKSAK